MPKLVMLLTVVFPLLLASRGDADVTECLNVVKAMVPTEIRAESYETMSEKLHRLLCEDTEEAQRFRERNGVGFGVEGVSFGGSERTDSSNQYRRRYCDDQTRSRDRSALRRLAIHNDSTRVQALAVCMGNTTNSLEISAEANGDQVVFSLKRTAQGPVRVETVTPVGGTCDVKELPLEIAAKSQRTVVCTRDAGQPLSLIVRTDLADDYHTIGAGPSGRSARFTLRQHRARMTTVRHSSLTRCRLSCDGHRLRRTCESEVTLRSGARDILLGEPFGWSCSPADWPRCLNFSHPTPVSLSADGRTATQLWKIQSRPVTVCLTAATYRLKSTIVPEDSTVTFGPKPVTVELAPDSVRTELLDADGSVFLLEDPRFRTSVRAENGRRLVDVTLLY